MVISVLPKTTYTLPNTVPAGTLTTFPVGLNIPASEYEEVVLLVRVHEFIGGANAEISVNVFNSAPTSEDPGKVFRATLALASTAVTWSATVAPTLAPVAGAKTNVGEALDVLVTLKQASAPVAITATISIDMVFRRP